MTRPLKFRYGLNASVAAWVADSVVPSTTVCVAPRLSVKVSTPWVAAGAVVMVTSAMPSVPAPGSSLASGLTLVEGASSFMKMRSATASGVGTTVIVAVAGAEVRPPASVAVNVRARLPAVGVCDAFA